MTAAEDAEMRQLTWFAQIGPLSEKSQARLMELRARDRRGQVRDARPEPVSKAGDEVATRVELEPVTYKTCQNCGATRADRGDGGRCPNCGFRTSG